jgi:hypothetical protein
MYEVNAMPNAYPSHLDVEAGDKRGGKSIILPFPSPLWYSVEISCLIHFSFAMSLKLIDCHVEYHN